MPGDRLLLTLLSLLRRPGDLALLLRCPSDRAVLLLP
jgi:hypothetical protein